MLVMVIEAACQLAKSDKELLGFTFKHTKFHSAFKVPRDGSGIEANLHLRPSTNRSENISSGEWYGFRLYTHDDDTNEWQEKCHGEVHLLYAHTEESQFDASHETMEWHNTYRQQYSTAAQQCLIKAGVDSVYARFQELGYRYGPAFRAITSMSHNGSDMCVGGVRTHRESDAISGHVYNHVIHPATLDCIFQVMLVALVARGSQDFRFAIPSHLDHMTISNKGLSYPQTDYVKVRASARRTGLRENCADIVALDSSLNKVLVQIDGFRSTDIMDQGAASNEEFESESGPELCHNLYWKPDLDLMSAAQVQHFCDNVISTDDRAASMTESFFRDVDFLVNSYIRSTLTSLSPDVMLELESKSSIGKYLSWMRHRVELLDSGSSPFSTSEYRALFDNRDFIQRLSDRVASTNSSGALYMKVGANLRKLLTGEMSPLDLLFRGELVKAHYYELVSMPYGVHSECHAFRL